MIKLKKEYIDCKILNRSSITELTPDLHKSILMDLHNKYDGLYTIECNCLNGCTGGCLCGDCNCKPKVIRKKKKLEDDNDSKGDDQ